MWIYEHGFQNVPNMCTYVNLSFVNVSMCPCTAWPVSPRYKWAKYSNVDHLGQSGWFKLKHFCRLSGKHDAIESLLQTLKECKTNQKHIRICIMSNGFNTHFESSKSILYHDIANRRCSLAFEKPSSSSSGKLRSRCIHKCTSKWDISYDHMCSNESCASCSYVDMTNVSCDVFISHLSCNTYAFQHTNYFAQLQSQSVKIHQLQQAFFGHTAT